MKKYLILLVCLYSFRSYSQVEWVFVSKKIADKTYEVRLKAKLNEPWYIYSQSTPKGGPLPTTILFNKNPLLVLQGKPQEQGEMLIFHYEIFGVDVFAYAVEVDFVQVVKLKANAKTNVSGTVEFMACTKEQCLTPQKIKFNVRLE